MVGVDLIGPLTETGRGNKYIFTATDYFTKWVEAFPIPSKSAIDVSKCFEKLFSRHGAVNAILTDHGREFLNQVNDQLCRDWNIQHRVTAAYHPQTNGLDEKTNQTLKTTLQKMVNEHQTDWDNFIDGALFSQRTKPHSTTKFSPFYLLYGREAVYPSQLPKDFCGDVPKEPEKMDIVAHVSEQIPKKINTAKVVKDNISTAHKKQQRDYEKRVKKGRQHNDFKVDDKVLALNTKKTSTRKGNLESNFLGPYVVESIKGKTAILRTKTNEVLKKKFSVNNLKVFKTSLVDETCETEGYQKSADTTRSEIADQYIRDISDSGCFQDLIKLILKLQHSKPKNSASLQQLLYDCPQQSFIHEVSEDAEEDVELYATKLLPYLRNLPVNLSQKTTMTMLLASVCVKASKVFENVLRIAETLKEKPGHLQDINESRPLDRNERLVVGGETLD
ncbi:hypothetical protein KUTeg_006163 [Tegillarca granosa]|uniref:Integrase catalytic domain-containing protein n=1 Tax=Tegillarca granosa TaxID=220873 RepID=A0ABQ9FFQ9_TEGGR|nr:hypothetical protein KUTeg_006163 [Tegillarca granosa]